MIEDFLKATNPGGKGLYLGSEGDGKRGVWKGLDWQELKEMYGVTREDEDGDETEAETVMGDELAGPNSERNDVEDLKNLGKDDCTVEELISQYTNKRRHTQD